MKTKMILTACFITLLVASSGYGLEALRVDINHPFTIGGQVQPAGQYEFEAIDAGDAIRVTAKGKTIARVPVLTRIARTSGNSKKSGQVVFDVVGDSYSVSEIWFRDADGYLLKPAKDKHTHEVIDMKP